MLQYLINTTIIWLACLLLYEWLLRKESFHQYNRAYLLVSLAAGLLLPAVKLDSIVPKGDTLFGQPSVQVYQLAKRVQNIKSPIAAEQPAALPATIVTAEHSAFTPEAMLWGLYLIGVLVGLAIIAREVITLVRLYTNGIKRIEGDVTIVETGVSHGPFSFLNTVFVRNRQDYNTEDWRLLIAHEAEHGRQLHTLDNMLLIALRILFWFHPLPHIYHKRLIIVHEFQADRAAAHSSIDYSNFLVEQSLLQRAPILTHSLNYSPLKNRIAMLTKTKSSRTRLAKYAVIVPLSFVFILFCTQTTLSSVNSGGMDRTITFNGAVIGMHAHKVLPFNYEREAQVLRQHNEYLQYMILPDSIPFNDHWRGNISFTKVPVDTTPVTINGKPIYGNESRDSYLPAEMLSNAGGDYLRPIYHGPMDDLERYLFSKLRWELNKLDDGLYTLRLSKIVIDENGNIAYYELKGVDAIPSNGIKPDIAKELKGGIDNKVVETLGEPIKFAPATSLKDGKPVNVRLDMNFRDIEIKGHVAKMITRMGC